MVGVVAGVAVAVNAGLVAVGAGAVVVMAEDEAGCMVCTVEAVEDGVGEGVLQPTINKAHKTKRHKKTTNLFILEPPRFMPILLFFRTIRSTGLLLL